MPPLAELMAVVGVVAIIGIPLHTRRRRRAGSPVPETSQTPTTVGEDSVTG